MGNVEVYLGDCLSVLRGIESDSIDLIITSPPYAEQRKKSYGGIPPEQYVYWFRPIALQLHRILKPSGTFILNIKEGVVDGQRSTYVLKLILELKRSGWLWTEEFIWSKKNCFPGKWPNRFRDAWERLLQFNKQKKFNMYQDAVKVPIGDWSKSRLQNLSPGDWDRSEGRYGNTFHCRVANWVDRDTVYPTNVLSLPTECKNKGHSATFPDALVSWFLKLFTKEGDLVLDPFTGSGTTNKVARKMSRNSIGIEICADYYRALLKELS